MSKKDTPQEKLPIPVAEGTDAPFLLYAGDDEKVHVRVLIHAETIWLPQRLMAELFQTTPDNIGLHLKNIYAEGELAEAATTEDFSVVQNEGGRAVRRTLKHYGLDAIIAVGYLGRQYRLKVATGEAATVRMSRGQLVVTVPGKPDAERVKAMLQRWYLARAKAVFGEVLDACLPRFKGQPPPRLILRAMQSRWGSLSLAGTMTLNANLVRAPRACIEYVVIHELCHLRHRDHDASFFRLLRRVMSDWEKRKQRLEAALL